MTGITIQTLTQLIEPAEKVQNFTLNAALGVVFQGYASFLKAIGGKETHCPMGQWAFSSILFENREDTALTP